LPATPTRIFVGDLQHLALSFNLDRPSRTARTIAPVRLVCWKGRPVSDHLGSDAQPTAERLLLACRGEGPSHAGAVHSARAGAWPARIGSCTHRPLNRGGSACWSIARSIATDPESFE
jgi:hypothetical protein